MEVVLQMTFIPVENQVNAGINVLVADAGKLGNMAVPLARVVADEIVAVTGQGAGSTTAACGLGSTSAMRIEETCRPECAGDEEGTASKAPAPGIEEKTVAHAVRQKAYAGSRLALVGLKDQRQVAENSLQIRTARGRPHGRRLTKRPTSENRETGL